MNTAIERACAAGHGILTIWVRRENGRARRFYEKNGMRPDGAGRSGPHGVLPIEIHEIRYRMRLEPRTPQPEDSTDVIDRDLGTDPTGDHPVQLK